MRRSVTAVACIAIAFGGFAHGQSTGGKTRFEVASVKPSPPPQGGGVRVGMRGGPGTNDPGLATFENFSLANLVQIAYGISNYQLTGPDWLDTNSARFDISAKVPEGATREDFRAMVQNLLIERFKLAVHHSTKEVQTFALTVGKNGPKLKPAATAANPPDAGPQAPRPAPSIGADGFPVLPPGPGMAAMNGRARLQATKETMDRLASRLSGQLGTPVTNATGLAGEFDYNLYWVTSSRVAADDVDSGPSLVTAIQEQLGLKLEATKGPVDVVVIDHIERLPTEN